MNIIMLSASRDGMTLTGKHQAHTKLMTQAKLLGLDAYTTTGTYNGAHEDSVLVLFRTDHEKGLCRKLAHAHQQGAIYVVENLTMRGDELLGTGGLEYALPNYSYYDGQHDDVVIHVSTTEPVVGDYTLLPRELGGSFIQCV